jgi:non-homologous end joining protein Ku
VSAGHDAFAVIRETIRSLDKVALARVVLLRAP